MTGSIDKYFIKGSTKPHWRYRIYLGKDASGKKQWVSAAGFAKQGDASDAMRIRIDELLAAANAPILSKETFGEHVQTWLNDHASQRCTPLTLQRYRALVKYVLEDSEGNPSGLAKTPLRELGAAALEAALYEVLRRPGKRREHISAKTVRHIAGVLSTALKKAFKLSKIDLNPMERVELPAVAKKDARSLTPAEIKALMAACLDDWTHPFCQVTLATGCRRGELLALKWPEVDLERGTLVVSKSLEQTREGLRVKRPKSGKVRSFSLPQSAIAALKFQMERQKENQRLFGADYQNISLVFCQPSGAYLDPALVSQTIVRRMRKAGIKDASLHTLRHTHASGLLSRDIPLPAVSSRLGHANTNITATIYAHAMPADDRLAADAWDDLITKQVQ